MTWKNCCFESIGSYFNMYDKRYVNLHNACSYIHSKSPWAIAPARKRSYPERRSQSEKRRTQYLMADISFPFFRHYNNEIKYSGKE